MHPGFWSLAGALELSGSRLTNSQTDENGKYRWHQSDPRRAAGSNRTLPRRFPKAHFETVLNMSSDAFATEARVVTQVVRAGSDVFRLRGTLPKPSHCWLARRA